MKLLYGTILSRVTWNLGCKSVGYFDICILQAAGNHLAKEPVGLPLIL